MEKYHAVHLWSRILLFSQHILRIGITFHMSIWILGSQSGIQQCCHFITGLVKGPENSVQHIRNQSAGHSMMQTESMPVSPCLRTNTCYPDSGPQWLLWVMDQDSGPNQKRTVKCALMWRGSWAQQTSGKTTRGRSCWLSKIIKVTKNPSHLSVAPRRPRLVKELI